MSAGRRDFYRQAVTLRPDDLSGEIAAYRVVLGEILAMTEPKPELMELLVTAFGKISAMVLTHFRLQGTGAEDRMVSGLANVLAELQATIGMPGDDELAKEDPG